MANPNYSPYLQYAPTFRWGGREWGSGAGDLAAFIKKIGGPKKYDKWARRHRVAAKSFDPMEGEIYSQVQPVLTGYDAERKKKAEYYQNLMKNLTGYTTAVMGSLGQYAPAIGGAYREAAETMGATGTGYGRVLNNDTAAAAAGANAVLANIDAPSGQQVQGGDAGGVLAGLAGWIPETLLNTQGGAFAAAASQLPKTASTQSELMMKKLLDSAISDDEDIHTNIQEVLQKIPGFRSDYQENQAKVGLAKQKFALDKLESERKWYLDQAKLAFLAGDKKRQNQYLALAKQQENRMRWESQGRDATGAIAPGFHVDPTTGGIMENGWKIGKNGQPVKTASGSSSSTPPAQKYIAKIDESGDNIQADIESILNPTNAAPFDPRKPPEANRPSFQKLFQRLLTSYSHLAKGNPKAMAYLKQLIRSKLIAAGVKPKTGGAA